MTAEQKRLLEDLIYRVQRIVAHAEGACIPYELAAAIDRADTAQAACYQFVGALSADGGPS